jgi:hypothetical protein
MKTGFLTQQPIGAGVIDARVVGTQALPEFPAVMIILFGAFVTHQPEFVI